MKSQILLITSFFLSSLLSPVFAGQNALHFDGIDDDIEVPNASAFIANSNSISLTCWVYPENVNPVFPDYDGFAGFRDDATADFYLVQIGPNHVEGRFRNSSGSAFTINDTTLQLNTWQHYSLTYDGSTLKLFRNAQLMDSTAANGTIASTTSTFYIGNNLYNFNNFYFNGMIDEVTLWTSPLDAQTINCIYNHSISPANFGVQLFYSFNEGIANGTNLQTDTLIDFTGHANGALNNFSLSGDSSNWVNGINNYQVNDVVICSNDTTTLGNSVVTFPSASGCDSVIETDVIRLDATVSVGAGTLTANQNGNVTYAWLNCNTHTNVTGETGQIFSPPASGTYALIISGTSCQDTSACFPVIADNISENFFAQIKIYPNPANQYLNIEFPSILNEKLNYSFEDLDGRIIKSFYSENNNIKINISDLSKGIYLLKIKSGKGIFTKKIIVQ